MSVTRRAALLTGAGALAQGALPAQAQHHSMVPEETAEQAIAAFVGTAPVSEGGVTLTLPDIAEDGVRVRVDIEAPGAVELVLIAPANPIPQVLLTRFGPMAADQSVSSRMRLADTQEVIVLARMPEGHVRRATRHIDVLVGGCG